MFGRTTRLLAASVTLAIVGLYLLINAAYLYVLPVESICASPLVAADVMQTLFGRAGVVLVSLFVMISSFSSVNGAMLAVVARNVTCRGATSPTIIGSTMPLWWLPTSMTGPSSARAVAAMMRRTTPRRGPAVIKVSVLYPQKAGAKFDMDYYCKKHIPMVQQKLGAACKKVEIDQGIGGGAPGALPAAVGGEDVAERRELVVVRGALLVIHHQEPLRPGADLLGDLRLALLAHRTNDPEDPSRWLTARELLRAATRGSADCLGRPELGRIAVGARADLVAWDMTTVDRVGVHDPVAGLLLTGLSSHASLVVVEGEVLVEGGVPTQLDVAAVAARAHAAVPSLP